MSWRWAIAVVIINWLLVMMVMPLLAPQCQPSPPPTCYGVFCTSQYAQDWSVKLLLDIDILCRVHRVDYFVLELNQHRAYDGAPLHIAVDRTQWHSISRGEWSLRGVFTVSHLDEHTAFVSNANRTGTALLHFYDLVLNRTAIAGASPLDDHSLQFFVQSRLLSLPPRMVFPLRRATIHGAMVQIAQRPCDVGRLFPFHQHIAIDVSPLRSEWSLLESATSDTCTFEQRRTIARTIPKIIHTVWVGGKRSPPYEVMRSCKRLHPEWRYVFWHDELLSTRRFHMQKEIDAFPQLNGKADLYRWELLHTFGGIWIDADTVCLRPFDELLLETSFFTNFHCLSNPFAPVCQSSRLLANNVVGSTKAHPLLAELMNDIKHTIMDNLGSPAW
jgi:hypothetical protein